MYGVESVKITDKTGSTSKWQVLTITDYLGSTTEITIAGLKSERFLSLNEADLPASLQEQSA
jgi:hypothetical protein